MNKPTTILCILDGFGQGDHTSHNAIHLANTPTIDTLYASYPVSFIEASAHYVGLPDGQMGNSEVGHVNIGAGRMILQDLPRINKVFSEGGLAHNEGYKNTITQLQHDKGCAHVVGLLSPGGVHGHINHVIHMVQQLHDDGITTYLHLIGDGRDTPPKKILDYYNNIKKSIPPSCHIATIQGRFFAMDRDNNWDRVSQAFNLIVHAESHHQAPSLEVAINDAYSQDKTDEFIPPTLINSPPSIQPQDAVILTNFRPDRMRQFAHILADEICDYADRGHYKPIKNLLAMKLYEQNLQPYFKILFTDTKPDNVLGAMLAKHDKTQLRIAETEKYAHITFFMNGGRDDAFQGEERILIPSPKVATYDMQPEMAAYEVTKNIIEAVNNSRYDVIIVNYANADMVGHTGNIEASIKAVETLDNCLHQLEQAILHHHGTLFVTADHGNIECLFDEENQQKHTQHTLNKVPFVTISNQAYAVSNHAMHDGALQDIAPTILYHLGLACPPEMTGRQLINKI